MALIVQKNGFKIGNTTFQIGDIIPKEIEEENNLLRQVNLGNLVALPDEVVGDIQFSKINDRYIDINKNVKKLKSIIDTIENPCTLDELEAEEAKNKDRKSIHEAIQRQKVKLNKQ